MKYLPLENIYEFLYIGCIHFVWLITKFHPSGDGLTNGSLRSTLSDFKDAKWDGLLLTGLL